MPKDAVAKFKEKLEAVAKETGLDYEILVEDFNEHIENNHLFAGWFMPGTVLAKATDGETTIIYEVDGEIDAQLISPTGEPVRSFGQTFSRFENEDILIIDDKNIEALINGDSGTGYSFAIASNSKVKVYIEGSSIDPVISKDLSVARNILNKDIALELLKAAFNEVKPEDRLPDGKINRRLDALEEAAMQLGFDDMPDPPSEPDDEPSAIESDIPHFFDTEEGKKALEEARIVDPEDEEYEVVEDPEEKPKKKTSAKKSPKKDAKSPAPKEKKMDKAPIKKEKDDEEDNYRFDLLPLDLIGEFIDAFEDAEEANFLASIEEYKRGDKRLIDAALSFAKANYKDAVDAVMGLAEIAAVAEEITDEEAKKPDATGYINDAVMNYLLSLRDSMDRKNAILHNLVCAAWREKEVA